MKSTAAGMNENSQIVILVENSSSLAALHPLHFYWGHLDFFPTIKSPQPSRALMPTMAHSLISSSPMEVEGTDKKMDKIKRPLNAYIIFANEAREHIARDNPNNKPKEVVSSDNA